jgi:hypothetical protein
MTFSDVVMACAKNSEFVANWARLRGVHLPTTPLAMMIDEATGHGREIGQLFIADVIDLVISRLPDEAEHRP